MWQRFTERAKRVVYFAQEDARKRGLAFVDTEHLLMGILLESQNAPKSSAPDTVWPPPPQTPRSRYNLACHMLTALNITPENVQANLAPHLQSGTVLPLINDMQLAPGGKRIIDLGYSEARLLRHNHIGTEHLLLGLISDKKGAAGQVLAALGAELEQARLVAAKLRGAGTMNGMETPAQDLQIKTSRWWTWWRRK